MTPIRPAETRDYDAYVRLFAELGVDDPVPRRDDWTRDLHPGLLVYERDGAVVGYTSFHKFASAGHVMNIAVAPDARRGGVGRALMAAAADGLRRQGASEWHLNVKIDNAPAIALYESLGMRRQYLSAFTRLPWACVERLPAGDAAFSLADPNDDVELERALGVLAGRLARARSRPGRVIAQLRDATGAAVGVASFDPAHPGAYPFCVTKPEYARALLDGFRAYARPGDAYLGVAVEDHDALVDAIAAAGGDVRLRIAHYRGEL